MKQLPLILFVTALSLMSCKSTQDSVDNGKETIGIEKNMETDNYADNTAGTDSEGKTAANNTSNEKQSIRDLVGQWEWVKTDCCGRMTGEILPKEDEPKRIISFSNDGKANYFINDTKDATNEYTFKIGSLGPKQPTVKIGEHQPAMFMVEDETLILSWGYMDLQVEYYKRIK